MNRHEEGAALLSVLLLVAVMGALSAVALERLQLSTRLTSNSIAIDQGRAIAYGAEALAIRQIKDLTATPEAGVPSLDTSWKRKPIETTVAGGSMTVMLDDAANCFNLNSVVQGDIEAGFAAQEQGVIQFSALMLQLGISATEARVIAASLVDWIDGDKVANPEGAEDQFYRGRPVPYRAADTLLADPSELRAVRGVTPAIYERLRPWICALPTSDLSPLNLNTLTEDEAPLIVMLLPGSLDVGGARTLIRQRPAGGWTAPEQFWKAPAMSAMVPPMEVQSQPQVTTRWFSLAVQVKIGDVEVQEVALIDGGSKPPRLIARRWGSDE